uniref:Putative Procollagen-proline dioxygenase n=1 Tax=Magnetococcus massalia (strain MO-1) TaxID=451514 RepID=A0A1S7LFY1_MAGMO|nr:Putative Procollagen-proline dioxygenase [Candidatus Magnetococcus massalia]
MMSEQPEFANYRPDYDSLTVVHTEPLVGYLDHIISPVECEYLIKLAEGKIKRAKVSMDEQYTVSDGRSGSNLWLSYRKDATVNSIGQRIANLVGIPLENAEAMQVLHYGPEQEYRAHYDAYNLDTVRGQRCCAYGGQRLVTAVVYLCDVAEGGATTFPKLKVEVPPKQGRMALFHNTTDDTMHPHKGSLHAGSPVVKGEKWAFNIWFHARPMMEKQDFGTYPGIQKHEIPKPNRVKVASLVHQVNRANALFDEAVGKLTFSDAEDAKPACFTYWDTYNDSRPDLSELPEGARVLQMIERAEMNHLSHKGKLPLMLTANTLEHLAPATYLTTEAALAHEGPEVPVWFFKDAFGTGGKGMHCVANAELADTPLPKGYVIQASVDNLALIDGKKFTARIYVLLWRGDLYLFNNGLITVHGEPYDPTSTDYNVQIDHEDIHEDQGPQKITLQSYDRYETFFPASRKLLTELKPIMDSVLQASSEDRYLLLGIDLLYQEDGGVQLVEINTVPNFINKVQDEVTIPFLTGAIKIMLGGEDALLEKV